MQAMGNGVGVVDEQRLIDRALSRVRTESGASLAFSGNVIARHDRISLDTFSGTVHGPLRGLAVSFGCGIGGKAATLRRPIAVDSYVGTDRISHHYDHVITAERIEGILAVPVVVRGRLHSIFYAATRNSQGLGERMLRSAAETARELEQQLAVNQALSAQLVSARSIVWNSDPADAASGPEWETVRETFTQLRVMAAECSEPKMREQLNAMADRLSRSRSAGSPKGSVVQLTDRDVDVLACVSQGMTNQEVADVLGLSAETVKSYLRAAMRRLGATSRWEAVVAARRTGQLP